MPPNNTNRISVSTAGLIQQKLLEYQATLTGRSISSLASSLLEEIIDQKVHAGQWHPTAIRLVEELIKEREAEVAFDHAAALASVRTAAQQRDQLCEDQGVWEDVREALATTATPQECSLMALGLLHLSRKLIHGRKN